MASNPADGSDTHIVSYPGLELREHYHHRWHRVWVRVVHGFFQSAKADGINATGHSARTQQWMRRVDQVEKLKPTNREATQYLKNCF